MRLKDHCPGCGEHSLSEPWVIEKQPVVLNYRFGSPQTATEMPRADIYLYECRGCGLIFNGALDEALIPYDENYDNRQGFSAAFTEHLGDVAEDLLRRYAISNGVLFEVGCGKGEFLRKLCRMSNSRGIGFDTSCEVEGEGDSRAIFHRRYATEYDIPQKVNAIVCRHVVEHVGEIGEFLRSLHRMAVRGNADVVYLETPVWEWIVERNAFWDVFYEHCNYFPQTTLARLAVMSGFSVDHHRMVFGGQYQALYLSPSQSSSKTERIAEQIVRPTMAQFSASVQSTIAELRSQISALVGAEYWGVWGAGAKGVTLANRMAPLSPDFVVDSNPDKCGNYVPGTTVPIVSAEHECVRKAKAIVIANPNYLPEIRTTLAGLGLNPQILTL